MPPQKALQLHLALILLPFRICIDNDLQLRNNFIPVLIQNTVQTPQQCKRQNDVLHFRVVIKIPDNLLDVPDNPGKFLFSHMLCIQISNV